MKGPIIIIGNMGVGKSTIGKKLAVRLGWDYFDIDDEVESLTGKSIQSIFDEKGEDSFRILESKVLHELTCMQRCVISCGGGIVETPANRDLLKKCKNVIYLMASIPILVSRVGSGKDRPLLKRGAIESTLTSIQSRRHILYDSVATISLDTSNHNPDAIVSIICRSLEMKS